MINDANFLFAMFSAQESKEAVEFPKYTGVAPVKILSVNPDKAWLKENLGFEPEDEPKYVFEKDGKKSVRVTFYVQTDEKAVGVSTVIPISFFVADEFWTNKDKTKVQIINAYGETGWLTNEEFEACTIPSKLSMSPNGVRQAYIGEASLVEFLKTYLGVAQRLFKNKTTGEWEEIENPDTALAGLENIPSYFEGDFSELEELIKLMPNNKVKVWFGVRTTDDNKSYQDFYNGKFAKNNSTNYSYIKSHMDNAKAAGMFASTDFGKEKFTKWEDGATTFAAPAQQSAPVTADAAKKMFFGKK